MLMISLHLKQTDLAFFELLKPLSNFWHILVLIVVTALAASSMDTLQNAISCVFSHDLLRFGMSDRVITWITRILLLAINIPAIIMSSQRYDVIGLFLVADIVCATAVFPVFLGLITEDIWWFLPAPTELAAFLGIITGIGAVLVNGKVIVENGILKTIDINEHNKEWIPLTKKVAEFAKTLE